MTIDRDDENHFRPLAAFSASYVFRWIEWLLFVLLVLLCGWATYQRNFVWKDDITLWSDVIKKSPIKARPYNNSGLAYYKVGELDNSILQYKKSLSLNPFYAGAHNNIGISYFDKGLVDKAISHFEHAIQINPSHADAHYNLGIAYGSKGLYDMANEEMKKGYELSKH